MTPSVIIFKQIKLKINVHQLGKNTCIKQLEKYIIKRVMSHFERYLICLVDMMTLKILQVNENQGDIGPRNVD